MAYANDIGFEDYEDYLASDLWDRIRRRVLDNAGYRCNRCNRPATVVHHNNYRRETLLGHTVRGLEALCRGCHRDHHHGRPPRLTPVGGAPIGGSTAGVGR